MDTYLYKNKKFHLSKQKIYIKPPSSIKLGLREFWNYRELLYFFTWRDIKVKYKQTFLGIGWVILQPIGLMLLFTIIFSRNLHVQTFSIPYPLFVLSGMIIWNLFQTVVSGASDSIIQASPMIRKIYFPRLILPLSNLLAGFLDFSICLILFFIVSLFYKSQIQWISILIIPSSIIITAIISLGFGLWMSALTVRYKDFKYLLPFILQLMFFSTSIVYSVSTVRSSALKQLLALNPLNGAVDLFHFSISGIGDLSKVPVSIISALVIAVTGFIYFKKTEIFFADL